MDDRASLQEQNLWNSENATENFVSFRSWTKSFALHKYCSYLLTNLWLVWKVSLLMNALVYFSAIIDRGNKDCDTVTRFQTEFRLFHFLLCDRSPKVARMHTTTSAANVTKLYFVCSPLLNDELNCCCWYKVYFDICRQVWSLTSGLCYKKFYDHNSWTMLQFGS